MKLIVGLGNPGEKYQHNRHNVGFMFVDIIADEWKADKYSNSLISKTDDFIIAKPQTFMNNSGTAVKKLIGNWELEIGNLIVVHDDLDIPLGQFKIQQSTGPKLHNGIASIEDHLKTKDFWRVRIGVENRVNREIDGERYVLSDFLLEEKERLTEVFAKIASRLKDR